MLDMPRPQLAVYAAVALAIAFLGARYVRSSPEPVTRSAPPVRVTSGAGGASGGLLVVQVAGAVRSPGVYRLPAGKRVDDAVRMAGGPTAKAELAGVNLAAQVEDGRQVIVPEKAPLVAAAGPTASAGASGVPAAAPINLNTATLEQLDAIEGLGPGISQQILDYRAAHGGFRSVNELDQVPGIGEKKLAALRARVTV